MIRASRIMAGISRTVRTSTVSRIAPPTNIQATSPADLHCDLEPVNRRAIESESFEQKKFLISLFPVALRVCRQMKMCTANEECGASYHSSQKFRMWPFEWFGKFYWILRPLEKSAKTLSIISAASGIAFSTSSLNPITPSPSNRAGSHPMRYKFLA